MNKTIKVIISLFFFLLFFSLAQAQRRYTITEEHLVKLEKTTEDLKMRNEDLQKTLTNLQYLQTRLKSKLKKKETLLRDLKSSLMKFELETANKINDLVIENERQKLKISRLRWSLAIVSIILILLVAFNVGIVLYVIYVD